MGKEVVKMPQMGESITEGTIINWVKQEGDKVEQDEILLEVSTDKVDSEIPSPFGGVLKKIIKPEGETVEVGDKIAEIETDGEAAGEDKEETADKKEAKEKKDEPKESKKKKKEDKKEQEAEETEEEEKKKTTGEKKTDKKEEKKAEAKEQKAQQKEKKQEDESEEGKESGKKVDSKKSEDEDEKSKAETEEDDVEEQQVEETPEPEFDEERTEIIQMGAMRKSVAEHMVRSVRTSPHMFAVSEVDMTSLVRYRDENKAHFQNKAGTELTFMPFIIQACAKALLDFPLINSSVHGDKIVLKKYINIGIAIDLESNGLIVPVISDADHLNLVGLAKAVTDLSKRARSKKLKPEEVQDGTFSITNMGEFGSIMAHPIINQPQVAILGVGIVQKRPVVIDGAIAIRDMMYLSMSFDNRAIDSAYAAKFLDRVAKQLSEFDTSNIL